MIKKGLFPSTEGQKSFTPLIVSILSLLVGVAAIFFTVTTGPISLGLEDKDGDGISDLYQDVEPRTEMVLSEAGQWKAVHLGYGSEMNLPFTSFVSVLLILVIPSSLFFHLSRKDMGPRRMQKGDEAVMNDAVRRMCAFLEINPSLIKALRDSFTSLPERDRPVLSGLIWEIRGGVRSFEEIFSDFRVEWSGRSGSIGKALRSLEGIMNESDRSEVIGTARRTVAELSRDGRASMADYIRSLSLPTSALFALGVLLPVLLATMIPLAGIGGRTAWMVAFLLWVVVPVGITVTGSVLVGRRPMFRSRQAVKKEARFTFDLAAMVGISAGVTLFLMSTLEILEVVNTFHLLGIGTIGRYLLFLWGLSFIMAGCARGASVEYRREEIILENEGDTLPELMRSIGTSVQEGLSYERSLDRAFRDIGMRVGEGNIPQKEIFGGEGNTGEGALASQVRVVKEFSRAGPEAGGKAINALASHLSDLRNLEEEMEQRIRSTIGQVELTASLLAPVMIGSSIGIFKLLEGNSLPDASGEGVGMMWAGSPGAEALSSSSFLIISGIYLLLLSISTSLILHRLSKGTPQGGWHRVPLRILISVTSFTLGVLGSSALIG